MPNRINPRHVSRVILYEKKKKEKDIENVESGYKWWAIN